MVDASKGALGDLEARPSPSRMLETGTLARFEQHLGMAVGASS